MSQTPPKRVFDFFPLEERILLSAEGADVAGGEVEPDVALLNELLARAESAPAEPDQFSPESELGSLEDEAPGDATPNSQVERSLEVVVVDSRVADADVLTEGLREGADSQTEWVVIRLSAEEDGVERLSETLESLSQVDAIHVLSHSDGTGIELGSSRLDERTIAGYTGEITGWGDALSSDADLLIYGCDLASTESGRELLESMAVLCRCDVAASDDATGHESLGGDWDLEYSTGSIETGIAFDLSARQQFYSTLDISTGLQTHLTFDSGEGAQDASGNNRDGILTGDAAVDTTVATNQIGSGKLTLDGTDDYVDLNAHALTYNGFSEGTISAWFRSTSNSQGTIFNLGDGPASYFATVFLTGSGQIRWEVSEFGSYTVVANSTASFNDGNWHHLALTVGASGTSIYVDDTKLTGGAINFSTGSASSVDFFDDLSGVVQSEVGAYEYSSTMYDGFNGLIDDFRLYDRELSASDVSELYAYTGAPANNAPTFVGGDGITETDFAAGNDDAESIALQADGKILVAGGTELGGGGTAIGIARYNTDGTLDTGFGTAGQIVESIGGISDVANDIAVQSDGKIVVTGTTYDGSQFDVFVARYNSDGTPDSGFGTGGIAVTDFPLGNNDIANSIAIQSDGKIVIGGNSSNGTDYDFAVARYNSNGLLDTSFSGDGMATVAIGSATDRGYAVTIQTDGDILLGGYTDNGSDFDYGLVRFLSNGNLDSGFGTGGIVTTDFGGGSQDVIYDIALQTDGKIVVAGQAGDANKDFSIARYNSDGTPDNTFDTDGRNSFAVGTNNDFAQALAIRSDGRIVLGGRSAGTLPAFGLAQVQSDGTLDTSFGDAGVTRSVPHLWGGDAWDLALQTDGSVVVAGTSNDFSGNKNFVVARYGDDGSPDLTFESSGSGGLDGNPTFIEGGSPVVLDADVTIYDAELTAENDFSGATLTLVRDGGADSDDVFSATGSLAALIEGGNLEIDGIPIGTVTTNSGGTLLLTFTGFANNASVNLAMQQIAYSNTSATPPASVQIDWTFDDGNSGAQGTGGALQAIGSTSVNIVPDNTAPIGNDDSFSVSEDASLSIDWWDGDWTRRQIITFDNSAQASDLDEFPVLIALNSSVLDYSQTQNNGEDLRFFDADGTALSYEIEEWNESGDSFVWVRVPRIDAGSATDSITMYYGNTAASAGQDAEAVWNSDFTLVQHLQETSGQHLDSTGNALDATNFGSTPNANGLVSGANQFDGSDHLSISHDAALDVGTEITVSALVYANSGGMNGWDLVLNKGTTGTNQTYFFGFNNDELAFGLRNGADWPHIETSNLNLTTETWYAIAATFNDATDEVKLYVDGIEVGSGSITQSMINNSDDLDIGRSQYGEYFDGIIDEVRIYDTVQSADWIAAQSLSMRNGAGNEFIMFSGEQTAPASTGLLTNDTDADDDPLSIIEINGSSAAVGNQITLASGALLSVNADGTFSYDTNGQFESLASGDSAYDTFTYTVDDSSGETDTATASVTINGVNDAPTDLLITNTNAGGLSLNQDGGNDSYLIADDGQALLGGLTALTTEVQFSMDSFSGTQFFTSYETTSQPDSVRIGIHSGGEIRFLLNGTRVDSNAMDYRTLADGEQHTLSVTWNSSGGLWEIFVDGVLVDSGSGLQSGSTISNSSGALVYGNEQDGVDSGYDTPSVMSATLYDIRIFGDVRSSSEIADNHAQTVPNTEPGLIANWTFNDLSTDGEVTDTVSGNNLTLQHISGGGFVAGSPGLTAQVNENAGNGEIVASVTAVDPDAGDTFTYLLTDDAGGRFAIDNSGQITVANGSPLDYESSSSHNVTIRATDADGLTYDEVFTIEVSDVNDPPVAASIEGTALAYSENGGAVPITSSLTLSDVDDANLESATVQITGNYANGQDVLAVVDQLGITGSWDAPSGTLMLSGTATVAQYQTVMQSITYENTSDNPSTLTRTVSFTINDGDADSNTLTRNINISATNDDPINSGSLPSDLAVTEDTVSDVNLSAIDLNDVDHGGGNLTVTLTTSTGGNLTASSGGGVSISGSGTGTLTLTGALADLNAFLDTASNIQYLHGTSDTFGNDADSIQVVVNDGGNTGSGGGTNINLGTVNVDITATDDAPILVNNNALPVPEDATITITSAYLRATDVDNTPSEITYTLTSLASNGDVRLSGTTLGIGGTFTQDDIDNNRVTYRDNDSGNSTSFDLTVTDGTNVIGPFTFGINGTPVNDPPVAASIEGTALAYSENSGAVAITSTLSLSDVDDTDLESAVVQITGNYANGQDVLDVVDQFGITGSWNAGAGTLTLSGTATVAQYQSLIRSIIYANTSDNPGTLTRTVSFTVNDGELNSNTLTRDIAIDAINDDPTNAGSLPTDVSVTEDVVSNIDLSAINLSDPDANSGNLTVTLTTASGGNLTASSSGGVTAAGSGTGTLALSGTLANLNTFLDNTTHISYLHGTPNTFGDNTDTIQVIVNDGGNTGSGGGGNINLGIVNVDIAGVNDEQTLTTNAGATVVEGSNGNILSTAMLETNDVDNSAAQLTYTIDAAATNGTLRLSGTALSVGQIFTQADIDAGIVTYDHDGSESSADSFDFTVDDGAGATSNGTFNWAVTALNDAPSQTAIEGTPLAYAENAGPVNVTSMLALADVDDTNLESATIQITGNYTNGQDVLAVADQFGITGSWDATSGTLTLSGTATVSQYQSVIRSVTYENSSDAPSTATRTLRFVVNDGDVDSVAMTRDIVITATNDQPTAFDDPGDHASVVNAFSLIGYWRLDETSGPIANDLTGNNDGTYNGVTNGVSGALANAANSAASFNGTSDYIEIPHDPAYLIDRGTVQFWFNTSSSGSYQDIFSKDASGFGNGGHLSIGIDVSGSAVVRLQSDSVSYFVQSGVATVSTGTWHHLSFSFGPEGMRLYLDGQLADTESYSGGLGSSSGGSGSNDPIVLGASAQTSGDGVATPLADFFTGSIDEVALFESQLSDDEVDSLYQSGRRHYAVGEDATLVVALSHGVLADDYDVDGDALSVSEVQGSAAAVGSSVSLSSGALVTLNADGSFTYDPNGQFDALSAGQTTTDSFSYTVDDGNGQTDSATVTVVVNGNNDTAQLSSLETSSINYNENDGVVTLTSSLSLSDVDDTNLESATVQITGNYANGQDVLAVVDQFGITGSWDSASGTLTLSGTATLAQYQSVMQSITYENTSDNPSVLTRTVSFTVNDGDVDSNTLTRDISVSATNDDPTNAGSLPSDITVTEDVSSNVDLSAIDLSDLDDNGGSLTVTLATSTGGNSSASSGGGVTVGGSGTGTLTLSGTLTDLNAFLDTASNIQYLHGTPNTFGDDADSISVTVNDGGNTGSGGGGNINLGTVNVDIAAVNDEQVIATNTGVTVAEGSTGNVIFNTMLRATDVDNSAAQLVYTVDAVPANGTLLRSGVALAVSDTFTQADLDAGIITYNHDGSSTTADAFDFTVDDGVGATSAGTFNWAINGVNDAPLTSAIELTPIAYTENDGPVAITSTLSLSDDDDVNLESAIVRITSNYANGEDVLAVVDQFGITGSWDAALGTLTLSGTATVAQYQSVIQSITYENTSDDPSTLTRTVAFTVNDGDVNSNSQMRDINVAAVNNPVGPISDTDAAAETIAEDAAIGASVGITALAVDADAADTITYSLDDDAGGKFNIATSIGVVTVAGQLDYETATTENITIRATSSDGSSSTLAISIAVTNVNEAPDANGESFSVQPGETLSVGGNGLIFNDSDIDGDAISVILVTPPSNGTLNLLPGGTFTYTPNPNFFGQDSFFYRLTDGSLMSGLAEATIEVPVVGPAAETSAIDQTDPSDPVDQSDPSDQSDQSDTSDQTDQTDQSDPSEQGDSPVPTGDGTASAKAPSQDESVKRTSPRDQQLDEMEIGFTQQQVFRYFATTDAAPSTRYSPDLQQLEKILREDLAQAIAWTQWDDTDQSEQSEVVYYAGIAGAGVGMFSIGYVFWALRGGALATLIASSLPAWRFIDPIAMLSAYRTSRESGDDGIESLLKSST